MRSIEPSLEISEKIMPGLSDKKVGQRVQGIINYLVVEKTKSFVMLRVSFIQQLSDKRSY